MINNNILQHYKGYEDLIRQIDDAVRRYNRSYVNVALDFYRPNEQEVITSFLSDSVDYQFIAGYPEANNKMLVIGTDIDPQEYISCLQAKYNPKFVTINHPDVLGGVYNLGLDINCFGDLWVEDNCIYLYCEKQLSSYICESLTSIGHSKIHFEESEFASQQFHFEESTIIVNSLRLDKIAAAIIRKSREKAKDIINDGLVNVNYKNVEDCSFMCNNNDILSIRRSGRYIIDEITVNTRSGNYRIKIRKFV